MKKIYFLLATSFIIISCGDKNNSSENKSESNKEDSSSVTEKKEDSKIENITSNMCFKFGNLDGVKNDTLEIKLADLASIQNLNLFNCNGVNEEKNINLIKFQYIVNTNGVVKGMKGINTNLTPDMLNINKVLKPDVLIEIKNIIYLNEINDTISFDGTFFFKTVK